MHLCVYTCECVSVYTFECVSVYVYYEEEVLQYTYKEEVLQYIHICIVCVYV